MADGTEREGFILRREWRDTDSGIYLDLWAASTPLPLHITLTGQQAVMFVERGTRANCTSRRAVELKSLTGEAVDALYFKSQRELTQERERLRRMGVRPLEADIKPIDRFLMERFITGAVRVRGEARQVDGALHFENPKLTSADFTPKLSLLSLDLETDGLSGPLLSIAAATEDQSHVFVVRQNQRSTRTLRAPGVSLHSDERAALSAFTDWLLDRDPDVIVGWNVVDFDLSYLATLAARVGFPLCLGRGRRKVEVLRPSSPSQPTLARVPGRVVLDGIATLKSATLLFESFALDDVAKALLGRGKDITKTLDPAAEINRMAREDPIALARYNLEDCRLVLDIFKQARLIDFAVERQRLTGLPMDKQGGSVAAFDQLYLPRLHRSGYVAPSVGDRQSASDSPGGFVMDSIPGLYRNVIVLDFKSLYPSIIRTFLVDPLGLAQPGSDPVPGYDQGLFAREGHILPDIIRSLWSARDAAKLEKNQAMSQAIKIMMNSFYGVLGTPGCRFFDRRLVSSITKRGHEILERTRQFIEAQDLKVIYGDTDSVFVALDEQLGSESCHELGRALTEKLNAFWRRHLETELKLPSHLELEYETLFSRFLMPTVRGSDVGTKKRYAGLVAAPGGDSHLVFKGLEAVRTDWTALARSFQRELFRRIFADEPYVDYVREVAKRAASGEYDEQLVYRKRIRRPLNEYVTNVPPHVQAARKLEHPGRRISYVITVNGPEPASDIRSALAYDHYLSRQLAPAADSLLLCLGTSFEELAGRQLSLF